ncbi:MAG: hypothetical protein HUU15_01365 [Candidatus Brocadiae bacterium]|nr:hypothetical protein [Candidatus Brocadiia bacterium]
MHKGILLGLVIGAVFTAVLLKALDGRGGTGGTRDGTAGAPTAADTEAADLKARLDRQRGENETLRKAIADAEAALAAARPPAGTDPESVRKEKAWSDIAARLAKVFKDPAAMSEADRKSMESVYLELITIMGAVARRTGLTMEDVMYSPEGMPALLAAVLEASETPLTAEQRVQMERLLQESGAEWKAFQEGREAWTGLEQRLRLMEMGTGYRDQVGAFLTPEQAKLAQGISSVGMIGSSMGGGQGYSTGTRAEVTEDLTNKWIRNLKLDASHAPVVKPIVEEFIRDYQEAQRALTSPQPGVDLDWTAIQHKQLEAQIAAQRKLDATLGLTAEQRTALRNWKTVYGIWISEGRSTPQGED